MSINFKKIYSIISYILLFEIFSLFAYLLPDFRQISFAVLVLLFLIISLKDFRLGILILLIELIIGSKGYLFYFEHEGVVVSIRIAFWLIIMAIWFSKFIISCFHKKDTECPACATPLALAWRAGHSVSKLISFYKKNNLFLYFCIFTIFIVWGLVNGFLNKNGFSNIFFDFNGWLYFALILPFSYFFKLKPLGGFKSHLAAISTVFTAAISWLCIKTLFLLFVFSHNMYGMTFELYRWVRTTGVGEITQMQGGFHRIFFQSHIFIIVAFFIVLLLILKNISTKKNIYGKENYILFSAVCFLLSVILITFSRSFWVGIIAGILFLYFYIFKYLEHRWKTFIKINLLLLGAGMLSVILIAGIVKFPYPDPLGGFNTASLLSERAKQFSGEAGVSSRWLLLNPLVSEIKKTPILGQGFGATVTYTTQDPRILESSPSGEYTTYAFEWGWLDIWLKLGIFGILSYLILICSLIIKGIKNKNIIINNLAVGLFVISIISIFSPYLNHPLGIAYILIYLLILNNNFITN